MRTLTFFGITATLAATVLTTGCTKHGNDQRDTTATTTAGTAPGLPPVPGSGSSTGSSAPGGTGLANSPLQPGLWETTFTVNSFKAVNLPSEATGGSTDAFGDVPFTPPPSRHEKVCLSPDQAAKGAPAMMSGSGLASCRWEKFAAAPGSVTGSLICGEPTDHNVLRADVTGAALPNLIGTQLHMTIGDPAGPHMIGEAMMQGQRVGDCAGATP